jgi:predicted nucleic acid-binding protein
VVDSWAAASASLNEHSRPPRAQYGIEPLVGNAATAGVKRRRLTMERARQLVIDFEQVTIRELAIDILRAVDLGLELGIYAYDAYILEAARSSGFPLLALDGPIRRNAKKIGLSLVELDL